MRKRNMQDRLADLHALGFDESEQYGERWGMHSIAVHCSQCAAAVLNGVPTHESGCPNERHECKGCTALVARRGAYCEECA